MWGTMARSLANFQRKTIEELVEFLREQGIEEGVLENIEGMLESCVVVDSLILPISPR